MRQLEWGEKLQVGDIIKTKHALGGSEFVITRVTKRNALSARTSDGYEHKFSLVCSYDMSSPKQKWNTVGYSVFRSEE